MTEGRISVKSFGFLGLPLTTSALLLGLAPGVQAQQVAPIDRDFARAKVTIELTPDLWALSFKSKDKIAGTPVDLKIPFRKVLSNLSSVSTHWLGSDPNNKLVVKVHSSLRAFLTSGQ